MRLFKRRKVNELALTKSHNEHLQNQLMNLQQRFEKLCEHLDITITQPYGYVVNPRPDYSKGGLSTLAQAQVGGMEVKIRGKQ